MNKPYLSPRDVQDLFSIKKTKCFEWLKKYQAAGGRYIQDGKLKRYPRRELITFIEKEFGVNQRQIIELDIRKREAN